MRDLFEAHLIRSLFLARFAHKEFKRTYERSVCSKSMDLSVVLYGIISTILLTGLLRMPMKASITW